MITTEDEYRKLVRDTFNLNTRAVFPLPIARQIVKRERELLAQIGVDRSKAIITEEVAAFREATGKCGWCGGNCERNEE